MWRKLNFKVLFCLLIFVLPFMLSGIEVRAEHHEAVETLKIATWNIRRFGWIDDETKASKRSDADLEIIAKILAQYDLIVITEFMDETLKLSEEGKVEGLKAGFKESDFEKTLTYLSEHGEYDYRISPYAGRGYQGDEHYAFLFKKGLVEVVQNREMYPDPNKDFVRDPCWATFSAGDFDFTVIVVHIHAGDMDSDPRSENELLKEVFEYTQKANGDEEDDVILLGDFNMSPDDRGFNALLENVNPKVIALIQPPQTTNTRKTKLYDNIFLQSDHLKEYTLSGKSGVFCFTEMLEGDTDKFISDHQPVWAEFRIDLGDDDPK